MRRMEKSQRCKLAICSFKPDQQTIFYTIHMSGIESISDQVQFKSKSMDHFCENIFNITNSLLVPDPERVSVSL